ncbi:hypothetical protein J4E91_006829 [Alternaria rosae]|nr:hypothetical protein J4E91_006829 [Alternaria rosae]
MASVNAEVSSAVSEILGFFVFRASFATRSSLTPWEATLSSPSWLLYTNQAMMMIVIGNNTKQTSPNDLSSVPPPPFSPSPTKNRVVMATMRRLIGRISRFFTVGRYKTNYFHFDVPAFIDLFTKQLTFDQRRAIPAISIGDGYLVQEFWGDQSFAAPELRRLFPGLRKIYLVPEILEWIDAPTSRDKLVKVARNLRLDVKESAGLWVGVFDVLDETAVLQDAFGFTIKSAVDEAEESLS